MSRMSRVAKCAVGLVGLHLLLAMRPDAASPEGSSWQIDDDGAIQPTRLPWPTIRQAGLDLLLCARITASLPPAMSAAPAGPPTSMQPRCNIHNDSCPADTWTTITARPAATWLSFPAVGHTSTTAVTWAYLTLSIGLFLLVANRHFWWPVCAVLSLSYWCAAAWIAWGASPALAAIGTLVAVRSRGGTLLLFPKLAEQTSAAPSNEPSSSHTDHTADRVANIDSAAVDGNEVRALAPSDCCRTIATPHTLLSHV
jgi:hypothetical protein